MFQSNSPMEIPSYLPVPDDGVSSPSFVEEMGPIGPWATGQTDWSPLAGLTGTRPVVDRYSITRYSTNEWRTRNLEHINACSNTIENALNMETNYKNQLARVYAEAEQSQVDNKKRLSSRFKDIYKWKGTLERAIHALADEISTLEEERCRLKESMKILKIPEAIATECLDRRCDRPETELVRDCPEVELVKEIALIAEIRLIFNKTLKDIELQQIENRAARERLEYDWSDKKDACEIEAFNCGLDNKSTTILFKPGATRHLNEQSTEEYWEHFTCKALEECEIVRQKSIILRGTLDAILTNATRDLRNQADNVERALTERVETMEQIRIKLENDLFDCLRRLAETEKMMDRDYNNLDISMKVAQSRLDNRHQRRHVENCRDFVQIGLLNEVKNIEDGASTMLKSMKMLENAKNELMIMRGKLEREILLKQKAIIIDRDRCQLLRTYFPSVSAMSGYA